MKRLIAVLAVTAAIGTAACGGGGGRKTSRKTSGKTSAPTTVRLGYFPNVTHAVALVGIEKGILANDLGTDKLDTSKSFNAGPAATEAILSGAIDATFIGPSPSITAFTQSHGAVKIVSGAASGGAGLVVKPTITSVDDLRGKTIATPQLGNTQDVALRAFLESKGFTTDTQGGGDVHIKPQDNSQTIDTFKQGTIDGAWVPEPYLSRLVIDGGGKVLVDERTLWPQGQWVTTNLLVRTAFLKDHPDTVKRLLNGLYDTVQYIKTNGADAQAAANEQLGTLTGKKLSTDVISAAFGNLSFTVDPLASTLRKQAQDAQAAGLLNSPKTDGIYDLELLNEVLKAKSQAAVAS
jgi:NitT/TauT family transport system substrate-binding protein